MRGLSKNSKGQGAIEYLLIISGAILLVAIVLTVMLNSTDTGMKTTDSVFDDFNSISSGYNIETKSIQNNNPDVNDTYIGDHTTQKKDYVFFESYSTWYEKIPENPDIDPNSEMYIQDISDSIYERCKTQCITCSEQQKEDACASAKINRVIQPDAGKAFSVPIYYSNESDSIVKVKPSFSCDCSFVNDYPAGISVKMPNSAKPAHYDEHNANPASYGDGHMIIIDNTSKESTEFYGAIKDADGKWTACCIRTWDLTKDGINYPYDNLGRVRMVTVPLTQGIISYDEIVKGEINHALAFYYPGNTCIFQWSQYPDYSLVGSITSNCQNFARDTGLVPGSRIQLDPLVNCDGLGLPNTAAVLICKAMQEYGMIFVDTGGSIAVYLENLYYDLNGKSWNGILEYNTDGLSLSQLNLKNIPLDKLRVIDPLYPPFIDVNISGASNVSKGQQTSAKINITNLSGTADTVSISLSGIPQNSYSLSKTSCKPNCSVDLTINTESLNSGSYNIKIIGIYQVSYLSTEWKGSANRDTKTKSQSKNASFVLNIT